MPWCFTPNRDIPNLMRVEFHVSVVILSRETEWCPLLLDYGYIRYIHYEILWPVRWSWCICAEVLVCAVCGRKLEHVTGYQYSNKLILVKMGEKWVRGGGTNNYQIVIFDRTVFEKEYDYCVFYFEFCVHSLKHVLSKNTTDALISMTDSLKWYQKVLKNF